MCLHGLMCTLPLFASSHEHLDVRHFGRFRPRVRFMLLAEDLLLLLTDDDTGKLAADSTEVEWRSAAPCWSSSR